MTAPAPRNHPAEDALVCLDPKRPSRLTEPHGAVWLTARLPLGRNRHIYVGAATSPRWTADAVHNGRALVQRPRLTVLVMPRRFHGRRRMRGWVSLHRWCAHVHVANLKETR